MSAVNIIIVKWKMFEVTRGEKLHNLTTRVVAILGLIAEVSLIRVTEEKCRGKHHLLSDVRSETCLNP